MYTHIHTHRPVCVYLHVYICISSWFCFSGGTLTTSQMDTPTAKTKDAQDNGLLFLLMNLYIQCWFNPVNQVYILLKGHKLQFEKLSNNSETAPTHTPLKALGIRKDTFPKGTLEGNCTQIVPDDSAHVA